MSTIDEIYSNLSAHMLQGMMFHDQMAQYYCFIGLHDMSEEHRKHFWAENRMYVCLNDYYLKHHNKLIKTRPVTNPDLIPSSWYNYERKDVDESTQRSARKSGVEEWIKWEEKTKKEFQNAYKEMLNLGEIADVVFISKCLIDVDDELAEAMDLVNKR